MIATKCVKVVSNATIATCVCLLYSCLDIYIIVSGMRERQTEVTIQLLEEDTSLARRGLLDGSSTI